jgi:hypothetical protein
MSNTRQQLSDEELIKRYEEQQEDSSANQTEQQKDDSSKPKPYFVSNANPIGIKGRSHPLYKSSNSAYGNKEASEIHLPKKYHGTNGAFTKEFVGGMYRDHSLNCNRTRNTVLQDPSFSTNEHFPH